MQKGMIVGFFEDIKNSEHKNGEQNN